MSTPEAPALRSGGELAPDFLLSVDFVQNLARHGIPAARELLEGPPEAEPAPVIDLQIYRQEHTPAEPKQPKASGEFTLTKAQARQLSDAVLRQDRFWWTEAFSMGLHTQNLLHNLEVLERSTPGHVAGRLIPWDPFNHPDSIRNNTLIVEDDQLLRGLNPAWRTVFYSLGKNNLEMLERIQSLMAELKLDFPIPSRNRKSRKVGDDEAELLLSVSGRQEIEALALVLGVDSNWVRSKKSQLKLRRQEAELDEEPEDDNEDVDYYEQGLGEDDEVDYEELMGVE